MILGIAIVIVIRNYGKSVNLGVAIDYAVRDTDSDPDSDPDPDAGVDWFRFAMRNLPGSSL